MEIYKSKSDRPLLDWQWYEPSLRNITHLILKYAPHSGGDALDIGCGTGRVSFALDRRGYRVQGLDIEKESLKLHKRLRWKLEVAQCSMLRTIVDKNWFNRMPMI